VAARPTQSAGWHCESQGGSQEPFLKLHTPGPDALRVEVPALAKFDGRNSAPLKVAESQEGLGAPIREGRSPNGRPLVGRGPEDSVLDLLSRLLTGGPLPVLNASRMSEDGSVVSIGSWTVPNQKWHWGGVTRLSKEFAAKYAGAERWRWASAATTASAAPQPGAGLGRCGRPGPCQPGART